MAEHLQRGDASRPPILSDLGEKALLRDFLIPTVNPHGIPDLAGDDGALVKISPGKVLVASTDRVPSDLIAHRAGLLDDRGIGRHLAALNLSDIVAMGGKPLGLLLNLGFPPSTKVATLLAVVAGAMEECASFGAEVLGGDLSSSHDPVLVATSLGEVDPERVIRRTGACVGDLVYMAGGDMLAGAALAYFRRSPQIRARLDATDEQLLASVLSGARADLELATSVAQSGIRITGMDNTDGIASSLNEIASRNNVRICLDPSLLSIHPVTLKVASILQTDPVELMLGAGYDFRLVGTTARTLPGLDIVGTVVAGRGVSVGRRQLPDATVNGWDYWQ